MAISVERKWLVFGTIAIGTFVSVLDQTSVNLALPRIAAHFDATIPTVQWVALGYILTTGSFLLPMGRLSDMIGRKRVYVSGFAIFTVAAVLAGSSPALAGVILFKVLQGVGAAMIQANGMAIVTSTFPASERGKMIGLFITVVGMGAIAGPAVGGGVVGLLGWRYVFFMGVPFGVASIAAALVVLEGRSDTTSEGGEVGGGFDWRGAVLFASSLALFLLTMTNAHRVGWGSPYVIAAFGGAAALMASFVWWELRAPQPMLPLELFKRRLFSFGSSATFLSFLPGTSVFFLMPFYLQDVLGYAPQTAGVILVPAAIFFALTGPVSGRLSDRFGWRRFAILGLVLTGLSMFSLSRLDEHARVQLVIGVMVMQGMGMGIFYSPVASAVLSTVERQRYGIATAYLNLMRNTASVAGVALATTIVTAVMGSRGFEASLDAVASATAEAGVKAAFTEGLQTTYLVMLGFIVIALVLSSLKSDEVPEGSGPPEANRRMPSKV